MSSASASDQPRLTLTSLISNPNDTSTTYKGSKSDQPSSSLTSPTKSLTEDRSAVYSASTSNQPKSTALSFPLPNDSKVTSDDHSDTVTYSSSSQSSISLTSLTNKDVYSTYSAFTPYQSATKWAHLLPIPYLVYQAPI